MIIITGIDNSGKSSLALQLATHFNLPIVKSYKPQSLDHIKEFHSWANASPRPAILDRHCAIDDLVYGPIIRGKTPSSISQALECRKEAFLIFCCPSLQTILATYGDREQMEGTHQNLKKLYEAYQDLMLELEPDYVHDFTNPRSYPALIRNLQTAIGRM